MALLLEEQGDRLADSVDSAALEELEEEETPSLPLPLPPRPSSTGSSPSLTSSPWSPLRFTPSSSLSRRDGCKSLAGVGWRTRSIGRRGGRC